MLLLLLSHFSRVRLCVTPQTAAHQAPSSLGFSRQERWSGLPFPSPMHESEKWKWNCSVMSDSSWPHGLQPTRLLHPWEFPGKSTGVGCHCLLRHNLYSICCLQTVFWLCCMACQILVTLTRIESVPPALEAQGLNHWTTREVPIYRLFDDGHSDLHEMVPHCSFDLHFSDH